MFDSEGIRSRFQSLPSYSLNKSTSSRPTVSKSWKPWISDLPGYASEAITKLSIRAKRCINKDTVNSLKTSNQWATSNQDSHNHTMS